METFSNIHIVNGAPCVVRKKIYAPLTNHHSFLTLILPFPPYLHFMTVEQIEKFLANETIPQNKAIRFEFKKRDPIRIGSDGYLYVDGKKVRDLNVTVNDPKLLQLKSAHDETKPDITAEFIFANENDEKASMLRIQTGDHVQELTEINCMTI